MFGSYDEASEVLGERITYINRFEDFYIVGYDNDHDYCRDDPASFDLTVQAQRLWNMGHNFYKAFKPSSARRYLTFSSEDYGSHGHILREGDYLEGMRP